MKITCFLLSALCAANSLLAQNWTGAVNSDWNNAANWSPAPGNGDDIVIDPANYTGAAAQPVITGASSFTPAEMLIQNGAALTISGTLNASDRVEVLGEGTTVTITSGAFALTGGGNNARLIFAEDAHLQMEGGSLTTGQRLLFELGASGELNAGTITVGETLALIDGGANGSSRLVQNGGTITTNGEFGFENEAGEYFPSFDQTAGTLHINGALAWLGAAPGSGRGFLRSSGGTIFVTGTITNDPTSTMNMQIALSGSGALLQNSGNSVQSLPGDSIIVANGAQWKDVNTVAWQNNGVFHAAGGALFTSGNTTLNGTGAFQFDTLVVPAAKLFHHVAPATIAVSGNLQVAGTFSHNANQLLLNGRFQQQLTAPAAGLSLYDLQVNNSVIGTPGNGYGVSIAQPLTITHELDLQDGIVEPAAGITVKLGVGATVTGGSDTSFVAGYMEKVGNNAIRFPVGATPDRYRPLEITAPAMPATNVRVGYIFAPYTSLTPVEAPLQAVSAIEYWDLSRSGSTDLFAATVGWNDASQSGLTNCDDISMTTWYGAQWAFVPSTTTGLCEDASAGTLASSAALPAIGPVTIGFTQNVYQHQVNVCAGDSVTVGANTYATSGVYIDVLEDANGEDSTIVTILTVAAPLSVVVANNVTHLTLTPSAGATYQWINCSDSSAIAGETALEFYPAENGSYAVIVTNGACSDTSECAIIDELGVGETALAQVVLYPNPVAAQGTLSVKASKAVAHIDVRSADGRNIGLQPLLTVNETLTVNLPDLPAGLYWFSCTFADGSQATRRFVVQ